MGAGEPMEYGSPPYENDWRIRQFAMLEKRWGVSGKLAVVSA